VCLYDLLLFQTWCLTATVQELSSQNKIEMNFQPPFTIAFFIFHKKWVQRKSFILWRYKMSRSHVEWLDFLHKRQKFESPPFRNGWATGLKIWRRGHPQWHGLLTQFHKLCQFVQKLLLTTQHGDLLRLTLIFKNSTLKNGRDMYCARMRWEMHTNFTSKTWKYNFKDLCADGITLQLTEPLF